ncbi:MAG: DUF3325 family protein [Pseudomonas sp.]
MADLSATVLAWLGAYVAFALCALSQPQQLQRVAPLVVIKRHRQRCQRALAMVLLAACLTLLWVTERSGFGILLWGLLLSVAGLCVALTLSWRPHWLRWLVRRPG